MSHRDEQGGKHTGSQNQRTSSYSYENGGCVEVAPAPDAVLVRDSKDRTGPALTVPTTTWHTFLTTLTR